MSEFDDQGRVVTSEEFANLLGPALSREVYLYDDQGRELLYRRDPDGTGDDVFTRASQWDDENETVSRLVDSDGDGRVDRALVEQWREGLVRSYEYDVDADGTFDERGAYFYDLYDRLIRAEARPIEGDELLWAERHSYDLRGFRVRTEYEENGVLLLTIDYAFRDDGQPLSERWDGDGETFWNSWEYDGKGFLVREVFESADGEMSLRIENDDNGNRLKARRYFGDRLYATYFYGYRCHESPETPCSCPPGVCCWSCEPRRAGVDTTCFPGQSCDGDGACE